MYGVYQLTVYVSQNIDHGGDQEVQRCLNRSTAKIMSFYNLTSVELFNL